MLKLPSDKQLDKMLNALPKSVRNSLISAYEDDAKAEKKHNQQCDKDNSNSKKIKK